MRLREGVKEILSRKLLGGAQMTRKGRSPEGTPKNFKDVYWRP